MVDLHTIALALKAFFHSPSYGDTLEKYIVSKNPKDSSDIERLTIEWQRGQMRERLI